MFADDVRSDPVPDPTFPMSHALVERAKGVLMALNCTDADAAWATLRRVSREADVELGALAQATIAIATSPEPDVDCSTAAAVMSLLEPSSSKPWDSHD
jgi:hypothetical protein